MGDRGGAARTGKGPRGNATIAHLFQLLEDILGDTALLKVDADGIDDLLDDVFVNDTNVGVRHGDDGCKDGRVCECDASSVSGFVPFPLSTLVEMGAVYRQLLGRRFYDRVSGISRCGSALCRGCLGVGGGSLVGGGWRLVRGANLE